MDIKKDKKIFIDYIYDRFEKYAISQVTEKEFVISIDHYNVNINLHYVRNSKTTNIYIEYENRSDGYKIVTHKYTFINDHNLKQSDIDNILYRFILAVSDAVAIYNIDLLHPRTPMNAY